MYKYSVIAIHENGERNWQFPSKRDAEQKFRDCVMSAPSGGIVAVRASSRSSGLFAEWYISPPGRLVEPEKLVVKYGYKVHSVRTANGVAEASATGTFYSSLDEALDRAKECVRKWGARHEGAIVYKAIKIVRRQNSPIIVEDID